MGSYKPRLVIVHLNCDHVARFRPGKAPIKGEEILCTRCNSTATVTKAPDLYTTRCQGCPYNKTFYNERLAAEGSAVRHRKKFPMHTVILNKNGRLYHTYHGTQEVLPIGLDFTPPPF